MKRAICIVISGDLWAGAEVQCFYLVQGLIGQGCQVKAVLFNNGRLEEKLREIGAAVEVWPESVSGVGQLIKKAAAVLRNGGVNVVHCHGAKEALVFGVAKLASISPVKIVKTIHGAQENKVPFNKPLKWAAHMVTKLIERTLIAKVVLVSRQLAAAYVPALGSDKVEVIPNAIDIKYLRSLLQQPSDHEVPDNSFNIGMFARVVKVKRHDIALDAMSLLAQTDAGAPPRLHVVGGGGLLADRQAQCQRLGLDAKVTFYGHIDDPTVLMSKMDLIFMPSDHEGMPMALLEAMTLGIPVVGHNVGGIKEVLAYTRLGVGVEDHSPQGYATAIAEVISHKSLWREQKDRAVELFAQRYDVDKMTRDYRCLYDGHGIES